MRLCAGEDCGDFMSMTRQEFESDLKPCPFCGEPAEVDTLRGYSQYPSGKPGSGVAIYCTKCNADMMLCREDMGDVQTAEMLEYLKAEWNKRAVLTSEKP